MNNGKLIERFDNYVSTIGKAVIPRGDEALSLAMGFDRFVFLRGDEIAPQFFKGERLKRLDVITLNKAEIAQFSALIRMGALIPVELYESSVKSTAKRAYLEHDLKPARIALEKGQKELNQWNGLRVGALAQLERAEQEIKEAQARIESAEIALSESLSSAPV